MGRYSGDGSVQFGQNVVAIEIDSGDRVALREVQERHGAGIQNPLHGGDVGGRVDADGPVAEHLVDRIRLGGALNLDRVGLIDCPRGEAPQRRGARGFVAIADDGGGIDDAATGTGLSIVRALVRDELQGRLDLRNDGGTRAEVVFPAA